MPRSTGRVEESRLRRVSLSLGSWDCGRYLIDESSVRGNVQQVETLKTRHKNECKGLIVQIRYLKAKWVRESALRSGLGYQKQFLLVLLARSERKYGSPYLVNYFLTLSDFCSPSAGKRKSSLPSPRLGSFPPCLQLHHL